LSDAYGDFFHHYEASPVLVVNSEHLNFVDNENDFKLLLDRIDKMRGRREYFNVGGN
jgi:deoxyadenosine/deoxycytidine kinase